MTGGDTWSLARRWPKMVCSTSWTPALRAIMTGVSLEPGYVAHPRPIGGRGHRADLPARSSVEGREGCWQLSGL